MAQGSRCGTIFGSRGWRLPLTASSACCGFCMSVSAVCRMRSLTLSSFCFSDCGLGETGTREWGSSRGAGDRRILAPGHDAHTVSGSASQREANVAEQGSLMEHRQTCTPPVQRHGQTAPPLASAKSGGSPSHGLWKVEWPSSCCTSKLCDDVGKPMCNEAMRASSLGIEVGGRCVMHTDVPEVSVQLTLQIPGPTRCAAEFGCTLSICSPGACRGGSV